MKPWGILGGSFDPIHNGHTWLAKDVWQQLGLERVIFVPAYVAPHKIGQSFATAEDRLAMTRLAVQDVPYFSVSDVEIKKEGISYTFETLRLLQQQYPGQEMYFIVGADSVPQLDTWHEIEEIFQRVKFAVAYRSGYEKDIAEAKSRFGKNAERLVMLPTPEYKVSSTLVRDSIERGLPLTGLVAPLVEKYIKEKHLYGYR